MTEFLVAIWELFRAKQAKRAKLESAKHTLWRDAAKPHSNERHINSLRRKVEEWEQMSLFEIVRVELRKKEDKKVILKKILLP
jgi:hypothetical protein